MHNTEDEAGYGTYVLAVDDHQDSSTGFSWNSGELAMVFSKKRRAETIDPMLRKFDLLFENGRTAFSVPAALFQSCFKIIYYDPDTVIDGCSTNFGWQEARKRIPESGH